MFLSLAGSGLYIWYQEGPGKERAIAAHMKQEATRSIPVVEEQSLPPWEEPQVLARVPAYRVAPDLGNVANPEALGRLTADERQRLAAHGFLVRPSALPDPVSLYRDNAARGIPSLITADTLCYLYRAVQAHAVAQAEGQRLYLQLQSLTVRMLEGSRSIYRQVENPRVKEAARRNMAYFAVAARLLDERAEVPVEVQDLVGRELDLIRAAAGPATGAIFPYEVDYGAFVPQGHYTWTPELERYYRAVTWYGSVPLYPTRREAGEVTAEPSDQLIQAILFTEALFRWSLGRIGPIEKWDRLYTSMSFLYGQDDALHPRDALRLIEEIFGRRPDLNELADPGKLGTFGARAGELAAAKGVPPVFKFVGPFLSVDRAVLNRLAGDGAAVRAQDLLAVLGSGPAQVPEARTPDRATRLERLREELAAMPLERWHASMAGGFLWALQPLLAPKGAGFPSFMEGPAWEGRNLLTGLSTLALLHVEGWKATTPRQEGATWHVQPPAVLVYVEPELTFYARMAWLARYTRDFLDSRDLLTGMAAQSLRHFEQLATLLRKASAQELANAPLNGDQKQRLAAWGESMAEILANLEVTGREGLPGYPGAVVTLYRGGERVLQAALGPPLEIVAVVPLEGRLYLARGAALGCREVSRPADAPLTDRQWLATLAQGVPAFPAWTGDFLVLPPAAD